MMNKDKKNGGKSADKWKTESQREERRERLAQLKSRDGGKKPLQQRSKKATIITLVIVLLAVVLIGGWALNRMGVPHRNLTALTVNDESISPVEISYHFRTMLNSYGIDPNDPEGQAALDSPSGMEDGGTVKEFVLDMALDQVKELVLLSQYAQEEGLELTVADEENIENYFEQIEVAARQSDMSLNQYLSMAYGVGMDRDQMKGIIARSFLAEYAVEHRMDQFDISDAQIDEQYAAESDRYDVADYRAFFIASEAASDASSAERTQAMEEAQAKAREILADIDDEDSFVAASTEHAPAQELEQVAEEDDPTLFARTPMSEASPNVVGQWVFEAERQSGDLDVVESVNGYYLVYFIDRQRPEDDLVDVRHILISANQQSADEATIEAAEEQAETILETYRAGDMTEEAFADLAREHSEDGNAQRGGIYYSVRPGQMVEAFDQWIFDPSRQPGDTDIVQTQFGFHVMYFSDWAGPAWQLAVEEDLRGEAFTAYIADEKEQLDVSVHSFGLRFVS